MHFKEGHKVKKILLLIGPPQDGCWIFALESAFKAKELELQTLLGLAIKYASLCTVVNRLRSFAETLCSNSREMELLSQDARELKAVSEKVLNDAQSST